MDNAAMYKKVIVDDGEMESLNDKRTMCMLLTKNLLNIIETLRSKVLSLEDLDLLEEMVTFTRTINCIVNKVVTVTCLMPHSPYSLKMGVFFPLIWQARRFEIHGLLCHMASLLFTLKRTKFFAKCNKVGVMNEFMTTLQPSQMFFDKFVLKNLHFHEILPPPPKPQRKYVQKYY